MKTRFLLSLVCASTSISLFSSTTILASVPIAPSKKAIQAHDPVKPDDIRFQENGYAITNNQSRGNNDAYGLAQTKTLALTFDDGPNPATTPILLDFLKEQNIRATFFVVGRAARANEDLLRRIRDEGHVLANHSATHANLQAAAQTRVMAEVMNTHKVIQNYVQPNGRLYFRAPGGAWKTTNATNLNSNSILRQYIGPVYWDVGDHIGKGGSVGAADWQCWSRRLSVDQCANLYLKEIEYRQGGIVLVHDIHMKTVQMTMKMIPILKARGYRMVTLDEIPAFEQYR